MDLRFTELKKIKGHNSGSTIRTAFIFLYANLHISASMCTKFGENLSSGVGDDALTRRWTDGRTDGRTDGENDDNIRLPPVAYKNQSINEMNRSIINTCISDLFSYILSIIKMYKIKYHIHKVQSSNSH